MKQYRISFWFVDPRDNKKKNSDISIPANSEMEVKAEFFDFMTRHYGLKVSGKNITTIKA